MQRLPGLSVLATLALAGCAGAPAGGGPLTTADAPPPMVGIGDSLGGGGLIGSVSGTVAGALPVDEAGPSEQPALQ